MKLFALALGLLASCSTLETLSSDDPETFRVAYLAVGSRLEDEVPADGLALSYRPSQDSAITSDILADANGSDELFVGLGVRHFLELSPVIQPYLGLGLAWTADPLENETHSGTYARLGFERLLDERFRVGLDYRVWETDRWRRGVLVSVGYQF